MPTRAAEPESPGVGTAAKQVAEHASRLAKLRLELAKLELAKLELKSKATAIGLGVGAAVIALFGLGFLLATIAVVLAIVLDAWLALLLVTAVEQLREGVGVAGKLRGKLPVVAAGALGAGFFLAGGIGATMRLLARKGRER